MEVFAIDIELGDVVVDQGIGLLLGGRESVGVPPALLDKMVSQVLGGLDCLVVVVDYCIGVPFIGLFLRVELADENGMVSPF